MKNRLVPAVMLVLLITSLFFPAVNAAPSEMEEPPVGVGFIAAAPAIPAISEFVYAGAVFLITGAGVVEIGKHLNTHWEAPAESWERFAERVSTELDKVFALQWVKTANHKGIAAIDAVYEHYTILGSPKGKDDKWYFEARENHGKVEVNLDRLTEDQAVKKMEEGKDIMTLDEGLAKDIVARFLDAGKGWGYLKVEPAHQQTDGYFDHLHFGRFGADERLHCWIWRNT